MELLNSLAVANWFIDIAKTEGQKITPMRVQKLVYLAHAWCLALTDSPLVDEKVDAWPWGPTFRNIYESAIQYGSGDITSHLKTRFEEHPLIDKADYRIPLLSRIWEIYSKYSTSQLSRIVNEEGGPWYLTWKKELGRRNMNIDEELIKTLFKMMLK